MPAQISHILHGLSCAEVWPDETRSRLHEGAFFLGCQGPDIFYHNQRTRPSGFLYGARIHRWGWGKFCSTFARLARAADWKKEDPGFAFLAGWLAHGFLDRSLHPFIVWFSGWRIPSDPSTENFARSHAFFERILDVLFFEARQRENFFHCDWMSRLGQVEDFSKDFWEVFAQSLWKTYPGAYGYDDALMRSQNAFRDAVGFMQTSDPQNEKNTISAAWADREDQAGRPAWGTYPRIALFHPGILPPEDFLNRKHQEWRHPVAGESHFESAEELFDVATHQGSEAFDLLDKAWDAPFEESISLLDRLEILLGNGSLNLPDEEGVSRGPQFSKPWDFEHLLELQRRFYLKE
jgi:hypothetical protein